MHLHQADDMPTTTAVHACFLRSIFVAGKVCIWKANMHLYILGQLSKHHIAAACFYLLESTLRYVEEECSSRSSYRLIAFLSVHRILNLGVVNAWRQIHRFCVFIGMCHNG